MSGIVAQNVGRPSGLIKAAGGGGGGADRYGTRGVGGDGGVYVPSSLSIYAGMSGGQGGGGGGGTGAAEAQGNGGSAMNGIDPFVAGMGNGAGGNGAAGSGGSSTSASGAAGGAGGNGGGAAGLCIMIAPSITYSGTVTGRHIKIEGAEALKFIKGFSL